MSREVKRVPLDFDAALRKTWPGFLRPDELDLPTCPDCGGRGSTQAAEWLSAIAMLLLQLGEDQDAQHRGRPLHPYLSTLMNAPAGRPSADAVELSTGLAGRGPGFMGHDAIDRWHATTAIAKAAGLPDTWGQCPTCDAEGHVATAEQKAAHDAWMKTDPPTGEGWQLWETVSEGSPISPVFDSAEALAEWMTTNHCTVSGPVSTFDAALRFVRAGWAPSMMSSAKTGLVSGVEFIGRREVNR